MTLLALLATLAATNATITAAPHARYYERLARAYFSAWNAHDEAALRKLFAADVTLHDWQISKSGIEAVTNANGEIWRSAPRIRIEVVTIHASEHTSSALAEILVHVGDAALTELRVIDVLTFDQSGQISSVRAYKG